MDQVQKIKNDSISEFGSEITQKKYEKIAEEGLWQSEKILIDDNFKPKVKILDIGCGSGRTAIPLFEMGYLVTGVDITPQMIETAKRFAKTRNLDIEFIVGDATDLKFDENLFDGAIFANNGWAQIPGKQNRQKALNEIYRVLKSGGVLILTAHRRYYSLRNILFWAVKWTKYQISKAIGLKIQEIEFGDLFFKRKYENKILKQRQFIHIAGKGEVEDMLINSGFKLILNKNMGEISQSDADLMRGSLSKNFDSFKSPVFYVCQK